VVDTKTSSFFVLRVSILFNVRTTSVLDFRQSSVIILYNIQLQSYTDKYYSYCFSFYLWCYKIAGALFNGDLIGERVRHPLPVPVQATFVVVVPVEEVHLAVCLLHRLVQEQHLQQRPRTAFPHTYDDRLYRHNN